jgi:hypothetical protein
MYTQLGVKITIYSIVADLQHVCCLKLRVQNRILADDVNFIFATLELLNDDTLFHQDH